ncbi:restriction endonuclease subunit S [Acetobacter sp. P1H12_c]|uniref:restriction endonuclease subunit S n=1 Tax=Acetobacter sp. P1H12_c TaxID=2762621 RepID=UPI001C03A3EA|nr:restriction endonuclease subunit S [Acetobacter sp. P1H12_c]
MSSKGKSSAKMGVGTALVPKLRFPEFRDSKGWKETSLQKLARPVTDRATTGDADNVLSLSGEHGLVLQSDYFGKKVAGDNTGRYLKIRKNDFVYNDRATKASSFGTIKRLSNYGGGIVSPIYKCFRFQPSESPAFWEWYFESGSHDPALGGLVNEGARAGRFNISVTQFLSTNAWRPEEPEQQKIAGCLDSVDALIAAQGRKVEALRAYKKGLMQQLFPQEGETQPRLRFPEFERAEEWEEATVEEIIVTITPPKKLQTSDYQSEGAFPIVDQSQDYICGWTNDGDAVVNKRLPVIVFGDHTCALKFVDRPFVQGADGIKILEPKRGINVRFLFYALEANPITQESYKRHFSVLREKKLSFPDPKSGEQQRIADCFTSLDDLITAESQKLDTLKTHKKGLMQQLFPLVGEDDA